MSRLTEWIVYWLIFTAILSGQHWSPPGGFKTALKRVHSHAENFRRPGFNKN